MYYEEVFQQFNTSGVRYLVAGGLALNLHGVPRATQDLDLLLEMTEENIRTAIDCLQQLGYESNLPVDAGEFSDSARRREWIEAKQMKAFTLTHREKSLQSVYFLFGLPLDYEDCIGNSVKMKADDLEILVISIEDLITLKEEAGREVDEFDLKMLRKLQEQEDE